MKTASAKRWATLSLWALGFTSGRRYRAWVPAWQREIYSACGPLGLGVPIVVVHRRAPRRAQTMARRLRSWGYRSVRVQRERESTSTAAVD